jgi:hypothetical protein
MVARQHPEPKRLAQEAALMADYTAARLIRRADGSVAWVEELTGPSGRRYTLAVTYPPGFPHERPKAFVVQPQIGVGPHVLADGSLCLFDDPWAVDLKCTALVVRNRAATWLLAYEVWQRTGGEWQAPDHSTGLRGSS